MNEPELRPWGYFKVLDKRNNFQIKLLTVNPNQSTSLQLHYKRAEHWIVLSGTAFVTIGNKEFSLNPDDQLFINKQVTHRISNDTNQPVEVIEVQTGEYFGEDDIKRLSDQYGRV